MTSEGARRAVLVTGASSGLGRATVLHLAASGFDVFAGVRKPSDGESLAAESDHRLRWVELDVTDRASQERALSLLEAKLPAGLFGLVNNAGICIPGPIECLPMDLFRAQLETNVVGQASLVQCMLPLVRQARGRIVNVTSGLGRVALPFMGAYACSQFAKEALSDVLRRELAPQGVDVVVVQPGAIATPIWSKLGETADRLLRDLPPSVLARYREPFVRFLEKNARQARESATTELDFARVVERVLRARRPRPRYAVGRDVRLANRAAQLVPDRWLDRILRDTSSGRRAVTRSPRESASSSR